MNRRTHRQAARAQRVCAVTGQAGGFHPHHIVRPQDLPAGSGDPHDPRNALRVKPDVHWNHHWGVVRIPLSALTDDGIEFAFEALGPYAHDYLHRRYAGTDRRVSSRLQSEPHA